MKAVYVTEYCKEGTVADSVIFGEVPRLSDSPLVKTEVLVQVKATAINVDDVALLQDTAGGGWFFHGRKPSVENPYIGGCEYAGVVLAVVIVFSSEGNTSCFLNSHVVSVANPDRIQSD